MVPGIGGGFGGKLRVGVEHFAALLARRTGRPVKVVTTSEEELTAAYPRQGTRVVGKSLPRLDAAGKVTGTAVYAADFALPGMLHGKILRSREPHARLVRIDAGRALALPGVRAVITATDVLDVRYGGGLKDETVFARDKVRYVGQPVAAVAATTREAAEAALAAIDVVYEPLPAVLDLEAALAPGAPLIHPEPHGTDSGPQLKTPGASVAFSGKPDNIAMTFEYAQGDVVKGEAESDIVIEDVFRLHYVTHCCMGVSGVIAEFDPNGNLLLYSNTQVPFLHKREFADLLGIDPGRIRIIQPPIGGGFGSKLDIYPFEPIAIFLAKITRRPVKLVFTR